MNAPSAHLGADKHQIEYWEKQFGFHVTKHTGWAKRGIETDRPITADGFILMSHDSVIMIDDYARMLDTGAIELPYLKEKTDE